MSRIDLPEFDTKKCTAENAADVLDALLTMIELIVASKADKIDRADFDAVRERIETIRTQVSP